MVKQNPTGVVSFPKSVVTKYMILESISSENNDEHQVGCIVPSNFEKRNCEAQNFFISLVKLSRYQSYLVHNIKFRTMITDEVQRNSYRTYPNEIIKLHLRERRDRQMQREPKASYSVQPPLTVV